MSKTRLNKKKSGILFMIYLLGSIIGFAILLTYLDTCRTTATYQVWDCPNPLLYQLLILNSIVAILCSIKRVTTACTEDDEQ